MVLWRRLLELLKEIMGESARRRACSWDACMRPWSSASPPFPCNEWCSGEWGGEAVRQWGSGAVGQVQPPCPSAATRLLDFLRLDFLRSSFFLTPLPRSSIPKKLIDGACNSASNAIQQSVASHPMGLPAPSAA